MAKYVFKIDGMPKDTVFNSLPFGRQIEYRRAIETFKSSAKSIHFRCKTKSTKQGVREFLKLYRPDQYFLVDRDGPMYHDDSFEVWFREAK
jgi:hypothetical protein